MTLRVDQVTTPGATPAEGPSQTPGDAALRGVAREFESLFLRQILQGAHLNAGAPGPYGDMAVEGLADGLSRGGGLGLARLVHDALVRAAANSNR